MSKQGGGILPMAINGTDIYFLFSRETMIPKTKISGQWSDFGGSHEKNETVLDTAVREGFEESNIIFKSEKVIRDLIKKNLIARIETKTYVTFIVEIDYDKNLPDKFKKDFEDTLKKDKEKVMEMNGLYEKDRVEWIKLDDIIKKKHKFRIWYIGILHKIANHFKTMYKKN